MLAEPLAMPKDKAREALEEYHQALKDRTPSAEDVAIMAAYKAVAKGQAVIDLYQAMKTAGLNEQRLPKLAIARADVRWCRYEVKSDSIQFRPTGNQAGRGMRIRLPLTTLFGIRTERTYELRAMVPLIPPNIRPGETQLGKYHVLWEAIWEPAPPTDPMLLKHLGGALYVVLAAWNLTEIERSVMACRIEQR